MYEQFENVMKLGPLSKVMAMIPGIPQMGGEGDEGGNRLKRFMYMMDSMTDDELDGRVDLNRAPSRVDRVARGSGTHPMEVQMLLRCHKQFEGVVTKMGKSGLMKGGDEQMVKHGASIKSSRRVSMPSTPSTRRRLSHRSIRSARSRRAPDSLVDLRTGQADAAQSQSSAAAIAQDHGPANAAADGRRPEPHEHDEADERARGEGGEVSNTSY